ncbi:hypothetical protein BJY21_002718 [Kineosphaera limosa]|uniref:DUF4868 domain-containing protein n=1 Tax=Kineosphaera limosa NBRC 100340 TaxID=1184609 RepID=K6WS66_9MICO|nr:Kiwa anti-phage protein KwaB-like domain-containing protein [Kineosphaera limosa]NYE01534.1 hypothetical protein [Kineosphaera limosa]GAB96691.1 hypothetical protein KILIM_045_00220 [Kineosphaera limosa NBRC 100340]
MTLEPARQALEAAAAAQSASLENFVLRGRTLADATAWRIDLEQDLAQQVGDDVRGGAGALADKQLLPYDPAYQTNSSQVLVEELAGVPELAAVDARLRGGDLPPDPVGDGPESDPVLAMVHVVGDGATRLAAYRFKGPGIAVRQRGIALLPRAGVYRRVRDDLLFYDDRFDAYTLGESVYFTTVSLIQTKLAADDKARRLARQTLREVTRDVRIDGYELLAQAVADDPTLRAKMASVARMVRDDPEYAAKLTTQALVDFVQAHPQYDIPVATVDGREVLRFDPAPRHRHQIPRLLADDYLHSLLTDRSYEAGSKSRVRFKG